MDFNTKFVIAKCWQGYERASADVISIQNLL